MLPLVLSEILGLSVKTLTAYDEYSLCNSKNLLQPTRTQLSKKQNTFSEFFAAILKFASNFKHFQKRWPS